MAGETIITLQEAKLFCKIQQSNKQRDDELNSIIVDVTADIQTELNRELFTATHIEEINIESPYQKTIRLKNYPVQELTSLYDDDVLKVEDTNYKVNYDLGIIERIDGYYFTEGSENVVVTYDAGYDEGSVPNGIKNIAKMWVFKRFYDRNFYIDNDIKKMLLKYQRPAVA